MTKYSLADAQQAHKLFAQSVVSPEFFRSDTYLRQQNRANWVGVNPLLREWSNLFLEMAKSRNLPLYVHSAMRTMSQQALLVQKGVSLTPNSKHLKGEAVDIVHSLYHWKVNPDEWQAYSVLGFLALDRLNNRLKAVDKIGLQWGGHWTRFYDPAHWELKPYKAK